MEINNPNVNPQPKVEVPTKVCKKAITIFDVVVAIIVVVGMAIANCGSAIAQQINVEENTKSVLDEAIKALNEEKDYDKAYKLFMEISDNPHAQYLIGKIYDFGWGVGKDENKAMCWYRKSAEQGNAAGQYQMGLIYDLGIGVAKDKNEAVTWLRRSADQGFVDAILALGNLYRSEENYTEALNWFRKSVELGSAQGQINIGEMYAMGRGCAKDLREAIKWFRKAADQGNTTGMLNVGLCYGALHNYEEALKWIRLAADQGNGVAEFWIKNFDDIKAGYGPWG